MCVSSLCIPIRAIPTASVKYKERVSFCCAMSSVNGTTKERDNKSMNLCKLTVVALVALCIMSSFSVQAMANDEMRLNTKKCLMSCINSNSVDAVQKVLDDPSLIIDNLNFECKFEGDQWTPMTLAAAKGSVEIAKLLVAKGADIRHIDSIKNTPLDQAAWSGNLTMVEYLSAFLPESEYGYATLCAARNGQINVLKYFIETKGLSVDYANTNTTRGTGVLLAEAAYNGKLNACKYLISKGATINYHPKNASGGYFYSALERAAQSGQLDIVKYLVEEHHAKLYDALELAEKEKKAEVVKYLRTAFAKNISIKGFKTKLNAIGSKYATEWKKFCDEGNLDKCVYIYSDMVMGLNSSLSKISAENLPEDIEVAFANLKMVCRHMNSCAEEFATLAEAKRKLMAHLNKANTDAWANICVGVIMGGIFNSDIGAQHVAAGTSTAVSGLVKGLSTEKEINTAYKNLINRINTLNKRRYEKWQELNNAIVHHL